MNSKANSPEEKAKTNLKEQEVYMSVRVNNNSVFIDSKKGIFLSKEEFIEVLKSYHQFLYDHSYVDESSEECIADFLNLHQ